MYYAEGDRHAPAAEPVPVNNETLPPPPSNTAQGDEQGGAWMNEGVRGFAAGRQCGWGCAAGRRWTWSM